MKIGKEVEGRWQGIKTLFIDELELSQFGVFAYKNIIERRVNYKVDHLYISDHKNLLDLSENNTLLNALRKLMQITIERTKISSNVNPDLDIFLLIDNESFWMLKYSDQIKFSKDKTVYAAVKDLMIKTIPSDFEGDSEIE